MNIYKRGRNVPLGDWRTLSRSSSALCAHCLANGENDRPGGIARDAATKGHINIRARFVRFVRRLYAVYTLFVSHSTLYKGRAQESAVPLKIHLICTCQ